ncbi:MAG: CsgG/HfaB family protein [bacterium]
MPRHATGWRLGLALGGLALLLPHAAAWAEQKATIAVLPFDISSGAAAADDETMLFTDALVRALVNARKFVVVDRARLQRLRKEQRFTASGLVEPSSRVRAGALLGAQYLVLGTVRDLTVEPPRQMAYGSGWTRPVRATAEIQVVDAATGQIEAGRSATGRGQARASGSADADGLARQGLQAAATQLAEEAVQSILDAAFPVRVLAVDGDQVRLNRGEDGGLKVGAVLRCSAPGATLRDPDTQEVLGTDERPAGRVEVTEVQAKLSLARLVDSQGVAPGNPCRVDLEASTADRRDPPPTGAIYSY